MRASRVKKTPVENTPTPTPVSNSMNFYATIPKHFLDSKLENPNIEEHNFSIPFRGVVVAPSGSGKTNFIANLIKIFSKGQGTFVTITIICKDKDEPIYKYLASLSDAISIKEGGLENLPDLNKADKEIPTLLIIDDQQLERRQNGVEEYYIRCRKKGVSILYLAQNYYVVPIVIRRNCNYLIVLKLSGEKEIKMMLREVGLGLTKEQLINMYAYATNEKFNVLIIDYEATDITRRYRKNFLEYLDPAEYV
jgi:hypothetical protein